MIDVNISTWACLRKGRTHNAELVLIGMMYLLDYF